MGGIVEAHAINREYISGITAAEGVVSEITLAEGETFKSYYFNRNTGSTTKNCSRLPPRTTATYFPRESSMIPADI